ncbi:MAG: hypothetical protein Q3M24_14850 [Candidatus Electrothrix aestuarii]|uniref:Secreted protein n=1 Tax=Candidatus Electrothrix aestuarii TaxID=3062594 RepID=A0AAU8LR00_9BACT|nr:hypothetical protein [Candidatus Electrothrix aestuarii]
MKTRYQHRAHQLFIALSLLLIALACVPSVALSSCDNHDHAQQENEATMPDFGFSLAGTCNEPTAEAAPAQDSEVEDDLLKDIEEPLDDPPSDLAATLEEKGQAS